MFRGYSVKQNKFKNFWTALDHAKEIDSHVEFEYFNDVFCNLKGMHIDLEYDYRSELLTKLFKEPQNLLYSGGSDSHTILKLSEKLNLKWESVVTVLSAPSIDGEANWEYQPAIEYCKNSNHNHMVLNHDISFYEKVYADSNFMYKNGGEINLRPDYIEFNNNFHSRKNYVSGHEKPFLIYYSGRWYTWMHDIMMADYIGCDNITFFFLNPLMPEIFFQDARITRNKYVAQHKNITNGTIIKGSASRLPLDDDRTRKANSSVYNHKNASAIQQLWKMGRTDIIENWLEITNLHYEKYKNDITWQNKYTHDGLLCWLIDIDSLESIETSMFKEMIK